MSKRKATGAVPSDWTGQAKVFGSTIKENVDVLAGHNGDPLDKAVTGRDLIDSGVAQIAAVGTGGSSPLGFQQPTTQIPTYPTPPIVTGLQASGAFTIILLTWDMPVYLGFAYWEIWRNVNDDLASATLHATTTQLAGNYPDTVGSEKTYYYWVRAVNFNNVKGPFNATAGTVGNTQADATTMLNLLSGEITSSELAASLQTEIGRISGDTNVAGSVAARIAVEATARATAVSAEATARATAVSAEATARGTAITSSADALQAQLNDLTGITAWNSSTSYSIDDKVRHNDKLWSAYAANSNSEPTFTGGSSTNSNWTLTGDYTSIASVAAANSASITAINNVSADSSSAAAVAIKSLNGEVFAADGTSLLATGSALSGLTTDVRSIYTAADGGTPASGLLASAQASITSLNGEVFAADNSSLLATGSALSGLTTDVRSIYTAADGGTPASGLLASAQASITSLNGEVFAADNSSLLATGSALTGLTTDVRSIYTAADGGTPASGILSSVQSDVTDLNGEVFAADGASLLATGSALGGLTTDVRNIYTAADGGTPASGILSSVQSDVTDLNGEVFAADGASLLATGSALSGLTTNVEAIYTAADGSTPASGILSSVQSDVTDLNGEVFAAGGVSRLATGLALSGLTTNVEAIYHDDGGVDDDGNAIPSGLLVSSQSAITVLQGAVFDEDSGVKLASAAALTELNTTVNGDGGIASKVSNIAASMYTDSDTAGTSLFATSDNLDTVTAQVFPDGLTETSRISQLSSALYTDGDPDEGVKLASADFVSNINTAVFGDGTTQTASANKIDTLEVVVQGADGTGGIKNAIETTQQIVGDSTTGLQSQYTVKIDSNGHVAGFGLANTTSASGSNTSEFIINADRFAITPNLTSAAPAFAVGNSYSTGDYVTHNDKVWRFKLLSNGQNVTGYSINHANLGPAGSSSSASALWEEAAQSPFFVHSDGATYIRSAQIIDGAITNAKIENATIDGGLKVRNINANYIETGTIDASKVSLQGVDPNFSIKSSASGARLEIKAANIKAFDSAGQVRVILGAL